MPFAIHLETLARARHNGRALGKCRLGERAQSLVEMAFILPLLLALLVGILELGRAWNVKQVITNAARGGARIAAVQKADDGSAQAAIEDRMTDAGVDPAAATITITNLAGATGSTTTVTVSYDHTFIVLGPIVDMLTEEGSEIPGSVTLVSEVNMRNE
jgi:Flp pilus assembly protein TadG